MDDLTQDFGRRVRDRRQQEKLSQQELADRVGISRNYLSQIERGESNNLSWNVRYKLSSVLGLGEVEPQDELPAGLAEFAASAGLPPDDVKMLAALRYRGNQPKTADKWQLLYNVIQMTSGDS
ncbi:MAG: helix-turn-helix transcriptional regulator [Alkalinema sp. RU_4_3]|nr:helix-turn-helix transcriptional regulator [Alkalinema sp. RU_4_3]